MEISKPSGDLSTGQHTPGLPSEGPRGPSTGEAGCTLRTFTRFQRACEQPLLMCAAFTLRGNEPGPRQQAGMGPRPKRAFVWTFKWPDQQVDSQPSAC